MNSAGAEPPPELPSAAAGGILDRARLAFDAEVRDDTWADATEAELDSVIASQRGPLFSESHVQCRERSCRVVFEQWRPDEVPGNTADELVNELTRVLDDGGPGAPYAGHDHAGEAMLELYLFRGDVPVELPEIPAP